MQTMKLPSTSAAGKPRMAYVDNIRWTVIAMVVLVHACVTYSGLGSWYYKEPCVLDLGAKLVFWMYSTFSQAFFMGLLFFVAAVFVPASYDRRGFGKFLGDRAFRLGIPALVFMLILDPLTTLARSLGTGAFVSWPAALGRYAGSVTSGSFLNSSGPLWFVVALLAFSAVYAVVRLVGRLAAGTRSAAPLAASAAPVPLTPRAVHLTAALVMAMIADEREPQPEHARQPRKSAKERGLSSRGWRSRWARAGTTCSYVSSPNTFLLLGLGGLCG